MAHGEIYSTLKGQFQNLLIGTPLSRPRANELFKESIPAELAHSPKLQSMGETMLWFLNHEPASALKINKNSHPGITDKRSI